MAPKKRSRIATEGDEVDLSPSTDRRFCNFGAEKQWHYWISRRKVFVEPTFDFSDPEAAAVMREVTDRHLGFLIEDPVPINQTLVREFYANYYSEDLESVYLRGQQIPVTAADMAHTLQLQEETCSEEEDEYLRRSRHQTPELLEDVRVFLTDGQGEWETNHAGQIMRIPTKKFTLGARLWMEMLNANLWPIAHRSDLPVKRAIMLYTLMRDDPFDMVRFAQRVMQVQFFTKALLILPFGSIITKWAALHNVETYHDDVILQPSQKLTVSKIRRMMRQPQIDQPAEAGVPSDLPPSPQPTIPPVSLEERLKAIEISQENIFKELKEIREKQKEAAEDCKKAILEGFTNIQSYMDRVLGGQQEQQGQGQGQDDRFL